jgi:hypothetical protein
MVSEDVFNPSSQSTVPDSFIAALGVLASPHPQPGLAHWVANGKAGESFGRESCRSFVYP